MARVSGGTRYPRWINTDEQHNLREVAPNLYVGAELSPSDIPWVAVIDLCGSSRDVFLGRAYWNVPVLFRWQFMDGDPIPAGLLDVVAALVRARLGKGPVLIHCQAGLSRSASVAYALIRRFWKLDHVEALRRVQRVSGFPLAATLQSAREWVRVRGRVDALAVRP